VRRRVPPPVPRGGRIAVVAPGSSLRDPDAVRAGMRRLAGWGYEPVPGSPADMARQIRIDYDKWGKVIRDANISFA